ncbi:hypothetical protein AVEN_82926-1 [Araneus ventricosus]|uniref:Histone-lysine N-methyltransferase SETMAR n=1 Tax=Araneus ventricosus TaxID=182803 RepID=A0A4Y2CWL4_ARAVE|nr:hypothetical protein AVEN_82926-1 [Araneus ventricosus]
MLVSESFPGQYTCAAAFENGECARGAAKCFCFLVGERTSAKDIHKEMLSVYNENCLSCQAVYCNSVSKLRDGIRRKLPGLLTRGIFFHQDNARSHIVRLTGEKIDEIRWQLLQYPPYSPELAPRFITYMVRLNCTWETERRPMPPYLTPLRRSNRLDGSRLILTLHMRHISG